MASWGNQQGIQYGQDMEPDGNYKLKVAINRECNAIEAANSHANGLALKVTGKSKFNGSCTIGQNGDTVDVDGTLNANSELHVYEAFFAESNSDMVGSMTCESDVSFENRVNHNEQPVILNDATSLTIVNGIGFIANMNGHGAGPSIDFYTQGILRGWIDSNGWNNA